MSNSEHSYFSSKVLCSFVMISCQDHSQVINLIMQFLLFGFTPASWFYPENRGMYLENERGLYVNIGAGEVMLPFRFGAWPEITVITLHKKQK